MFSQFFSDISVITNTKKKVVKSDFVVHRYIPNNQRPKLMASAAATIMKCCQKKGKSRGISGLERQIMGEKRVDRRMGIKKMLSRDIARNFGRCSLFLHSNSIAKALFSAYEGHLC